MPSASPPDALPEPVQTVLVVDDNRLLREMLQAPLQAAGYEVVAAATGRAAVERMAADRPDLVLLDIVLPDALGFELARDLRAAARGREVPIVAVTGFLSRLEAGDLTAARFDEVLTKPVETARLLEVVRDLLSRAARPPALGGGRRVLVVDDEPLQLKLAGIRLARAGFEVSTARDGREALEAARRAPPDAVLGDLFLPELDGFRLCQALRADPALARIPVVLVGGASVEEADRLLAARVGASALVPRTGGLEEAIRALDRGISQGPPARPAEPPERVEPELARTLQRQLDRQASLAARLAQRCSIQGAMLSVISSLAEAWATADGLEAALDEALAEILDIGGIRFGALYRVMPLGIRRVAAAGFDAAGMAAVDHQVRAGALDRVVDPDGPPFVSFPAGAGQGLPEALSAVLVPLASGGERLGALLLASDRRELGDDDWVTFGRAVGAQLGQAIRLTDALTGLAASERRYRTLLENARDGIFVLSTGGVLLEVSRGGETLLGRPRAAIVGRHFSQFHDPRHAAEQAERFGRLFAEEAMVQENVILLRPDGTQVIADFTRQVIELGGERVVLSVAHDVTDRRRAEEELRRSQDQLRQAQKMEAIGRLTGGIAHDFNNVLSVVLSYASLLIDDLRPGDPMRADLEEIRAAGERAAGLTRQLLAFGRRQILHPELVDLNEVLAGLEKMLRRLIGEDVELVVVPSPEPARVVVDPGQIEQVIMNLVVNARDAMPSGGKLTIEIARVELDARAAADQPDAAPGPWWVMSFRDTGVGMDEAIQARIFEPFFTTKEAGRGTGLGLSTVFGIVRQSGGHVTVRSAAGQGATFRVHLPPGTARAGEAAPAPRPPEPAGLRGSETILLVDDDEGVRRLLRTLLRRQGYEVLEAQGGGDALVISEQHPSDIHLLLTDMVMPRVSGAQLAARLAAGRPAMKVLYMSGYTDDPAVREGALGPDAAFIHKPFTPEALLRKVREALDARPAPRA